MDYKKKYEEVLERAKLVIKECGDNKGRISMIESIFPELAESKDEKIRKALLDSFEYQIKESRPDKEWICGVKLKEIVAWLEKQGEQKPEDKVKPKFNVGDVMRTLQEAADGMIDGMPVIISIDKEYYHCTNELIAIKNQDDYEFPPINAKQKPTWSEEDKEILKNLIDYFSLDDGLRLPTEETIDWLKSFKERLS